MDFHSAAYGHFLALVFAVYWLLRDRRRPRLVWLLAASYFFYGCWNAKYTLLLVGSTLLDYWLSHKIAAIDRSSPQGERAAKRWVTLSIVANLGVLGIFKYYNFFRDSFAALFASLGWQSVLPWIDVLLPPGISFYTLQSVSYIVDVYRGTMRPAKSLIDYAAFIAFFPQLVAGPIVRAADFLPQLLHRPGITRDDLTIGLFRILEGLFKKVIIADVLAVELVQRVYAPGSTAHGFEVVLAIYGFAFQVYADFSGYSDIAIGTARLFGFRLLENFEAPYFARSFQDFWRRWHISLSFCLRDYLYKSLGGNRQGPFRTYVNLFITMLVSGLWHGASWHFVIWGALHGVMLTINRFWERNNLPWIPGRVGHVFSVLLTFHVHIFTLVMFRSSSIQQSWDVYGRLFGPWDPPQVTRGAAVALLIGICTHGITRWRDQGLERWFSRLPLPVIGAIIALFVGLLTRFRVDAVPFVYFQF